MRISPCTVLVCLSILILSVAVGAQSKQDTIDVIISPPEWRRASFSPHSQSDQGPEDWQQAATRPIRGIGVSPSARSFAKPIVKCKPPLCPPTGPCGIVPSPPCNLPKRMCGQWELATQVFFARTGGTVRWPAQVLGVPATEADLNDDLGIPKHQTLLEYSAFYQIRPTWAIFYSVMPISLEGTAVPTRTIYYGQVPIPANVPLHTKWDFLYQRVGLLYQPILTCNASVSIYNSWLFNPQRLSVKNTACPFSGCTTLDRTRNMVMSGINIQKCIRTLCNGGTFSCDNRVGLGYLDGTFALDVQAGCRFSVPMNCGRWGFARGGYRWINFTEDRTDLRLDTTLEGAFVEGGLIF
jgi:hypothetical protein